MVLATTRGHGVVALGPDICHKHPTREAPSNEDRRDARAGVGPAFERRQVKGGQLDVVASYERSGRSAAAQHVGRDALGGDTGREHAGRADARQLHRFQVAAFTGLDGLAGDESRRFGNGQLKPQGRWVRAGPSIVDDHYRPAADRASAASR
jgi:hypothetical protein